MKVDELTPRTGRVNMPVKVLSLDEPRSMDNGTMICEGLVGDETGTVIMSFWNDEIEEIEDGMTLELKDARANKFADDPEFTIKPYFLPKIFETVFSNSGLPLIFISTISFERFFSVLTRSFVSNGSLGHAVIP